MALPDISLTATNFKCFKDRHGFEKFKHINIIIGRNNSGKSSLLDLIQCATVAMDRVGHVEGKAKVFLGLIATADRLAELPESHKQIRDPRQNQEVNVSPRNWSRKRLLDALVLLELNDNAKSIEFHSIEGPNLTSPPEMYIAEHIGRTLGNIKNPFHHLVFRRILADRDIAPEGTVGNFAIGFNGTGVTNLIERHLNQQGLDRRLITQTLLNELNAIFFPDARFTSIIARQAGTGKWELFLEEESKGFVPLSQTGSGVKTVLLVLVNLLLVPVIASDKPFQPLSEYIFAFEELENNLHPAIQRRLFNYLRQFAIKHDTHFFITTHSNVVIDRFAGDPEAQILHVKHDGTSANVNVVEGSTRIGHVFDDLDIRASDLLQANAVVWVEGPSDAIYFRRWLDLWTDGELKSGIHYQCLPFGGSANAHLSFNDPEFVEEVVSALEINRHAILLIDHDGDSEQDELKVHTARLVREVTDSNGFAWVTAGREVENYIPKEAIKAYISDDKIPLPGKFERVIEYLRDNMEEKSSLRKTALAQAIVPLLTKEMLEATYDMAEQLNKVVALVRQWNGLPGP